MSTATESYRLLYERHTALHADHEQVRRDLAHARQTLRNLATEHRMHLDKLWALSEDWRAAAGDLRAASNAPAPPGEYGEDFRASKERTAAAAEQLILCNDDLREALRAGGGYTPEKEP